jgi:hypothetical protein
MSARLRVASLFALIAVAAVSALPKVDLPETAFDETQGVRAGRNSRRHEALRLTGTTVATRPFHSTPLREGR